MTEAPTRPESTASFRNALRLSREITLERDGGRIGVAELYAGMLQATEGDGQRIIRELGGHPSELEAAIGKISTPSTPDSEATDTQVPDELPGAVPLTEEAETVITATFDEATDRGAAEVGTEHLLLALLRSGREDLAAPLVERGITYERVSGLVD